MTKTYLNFDDGWSCNLRNCLYFHAYNKETEKNGKKKITPQIKFHYNSDDIITASYDTFKERDEVLTKLRELVGIMGVKG
jgi:hypothetical protein